MSRARAAGRAACGRSTGPRRDRRRRSKSGLRRLRSRASRSAVFRSSCSRTRMSTRPRTARTRWPTSPIRGGAVPGTGASVPPDPLASRGFNPNHLTPAAALHLRGDRKSDRLRRLLAAGHGRRCRPEALHPDGQCDQGRDLQQDRHAPGRAVRSLGPLQLGRLRRRCRRSGRQLRPARRPLGAGAVQRREQPLLRGLDDRGSARHLLPSTTFSTTDFPDYFKIGVWPDGYYVSTNEANYNAWAFDRVKMLQGIAAGSIKATGFADNFLMPADVDGIVAPPAGAPAIYYTFLDNSFHGGTDRLELRAFDVDWVTPANSTFTIVGSPAVAAFTYTVCGFFNLNCAPQPGTGQTGRCGLGVADVPPRLPAVRGAREPGRELHRAGLRPRRAALVRAARQRHHLDASFSRAPTTPMRPRIASWARSRRTGEGSIALGYSAMSGTVSPAIRFATRLRGGSRRDARLGIDAHRRRRLADRLRSLGRLLGAVDRSGRRLHLLVHQPVLHRELGEQLGDADRRLPGRRSARGSSSTTSRPGGERVGARPCPEPAGGGAGRARGRGPARLRPRFDRLRPPAAGGEAPAAPAAQPFAAVRYQDLVVDQALYGTFDPATGVHTCADESRDSFVLAAGETPQLHGQTRRDRRSSSSVAARRGPKRARPRRGLPACGVRHLICPTVGWQEESVAPESARLVPDGRSGDRSCPRPLAAEVRVELAASAPGGCPRLRGRLRGAQRSARPSRRLRRGASILISLDAFREDAIGASAVGAR